MNNLISLVNLAQCLTLLSFMICHAGYISAQEGIINQTTHKILLESTTEDIKVDGLLEEAVWAQTEYIGDFWYSFPVDDQPVEDEWQTHVKMTYNQTYIYIAITCFGEGPFLMPSLKRDNDQFWDGDVVGVVIDPINEKTNAMGFNTNPAGVQFETLVSGNTGTRSGSGGGFNVAWDNKWLANSKSYADRWVTEIAIPFNTLKYGSNKDWGINFIRGAAKTNSWHTWAPVPVQLTGVDLGFTGMLEWDKSPPKSKNNISLIPYVLGSRYQDSETGERSHVFEAGADAKIAIGSNLNLDLTLNPDFSQVDVDEQVTNLTTVNIRFPERRLFFLENSDIFNDFGIPPMRPFFSRKIGLDDEGNSIPILYGARLSGNLTGDLRIGLMNLQTLSKDDFAAQNYTSFAFNQRIFGRTSVKGYLHNRQAYVDGEFSNTDFTRVLGGEIDYRSIDGRWRANVGGGLSLSDGVSKQNGTYHGIISYNDRNISFYTNIMAVGTEYKPDVGFMSWLFHRDAVRDTSVQLGYTHVFSRLAYTFYPEMNAINSHRIGVNTVFDYTNEGTDFFIVSNRLSYDVNFSNTSSISLEVRANSNELFFPFDFTSSEPLAPGTYDWMTYSAEYGSDSRKQFSYQVGVETGGFFSGKRSQYSLSLNYRQQPWGNFALNFVQNFLEFDEPYGSESLTLIGPKLEFNFSRDLFWTTFLQYNTQRDNFNINSRLQWQFQPLSNLFLVYSDNYAIENWGPKNRALVLKLNYWLNL